MQAVIKTGGKQYRVSEGEYLRVEKLDVKEGAKLTFDEVLMISDGDKVNVGAPFVKGGKVTAEVEKHGRGDKIMVIKFKRRKKYRRTQGHRQDFTQIRITGIKAGAAKKAAPKKEAAEEKAED